MPKFFNRDCAVVYVDDSPDDHFLFQHAVARTEIPIHIQPFFSAEPALAYLKGERPFQESRLYPFPALLLCDYDLKISEGPQLVKAVRAVSSCATLTIIMFSCSDHRVCVHKSYLAGADYYLRKPTSLARLDLLVRLLYDCAMLTPRSFEVLTNLEEYQAHPEEMFSSQVEMRAASG